MNVMIEERPVEIANEAIGAEARLERLAQKARRLDGRGQKLPKGFQLETPFPEKVGMDLEASDAFTPQELVDLFAHPKKMVDWDQLDSVNYFWEGE